jgi:asparagine synthase (glutamine-hydrolysing)
MCPVPGHCSSASSGSRLTHERYYRLHPEEPERVDQTQVQLLAQELPRAVGRRIRNIDETGVLLSGGVDSMLLLAVIASECGTAPRSFTFRYERYTGTLNESPRAKRCAAHVGSQHEELPVDPVRIPAQLPELLEVFGEPFSLGLHTAMLGALADRGVADLLTGSGADTGNLDGQGLNAVRFTGLPAGMRAVVAAGSQAVHILDENWRARHQGRPLPFVGRLSSALAGGIWTAHTKLPWITTSWAMPAGLRRRIYRVPTIAAKAEAARDGLLARETDEAQGEALELSVAINDSRFFDGDLMQMWNLHSGRAHGLAIRTPFLSFPLLSRRLSYDVAEGGKEATRQFAATLLPEDLARAPKNYQAVPINEWLRGPLLPFVRERLEPATLGRTGLFDTKFVGSLLDAHINGKVDLGWALWMLAQVSLWLDVTGV